MILCPDCGREFPRDLFVAHREAEHPPSLHTLVVLGVKSEEIVHGQVKE